MKASRHDVVHVASVEAQALPREHLTTSFVLNLLDIGENSAIFRWPALFFE